MQVSGFTFCRNIVNADYPLKEALLSIAPLCNEIVIAVGKSEDNTLEYVKSIDIKNLKIIETEWDETLREGGKVLSVETNKALAYVDKNSDWCIYIQADECIHEKDYPEIRDAMEKYKKNNQVQGLLFNYFHFYATYDYLADSRNWYRKEIRIIKNNLGILSYKDAQGFRISNKKLNVKPLKAGIYHYGWVKHPRIQQQKQIQAQKLWHNDEYVSNNVAKNNTFDYSKVDSIRLFNSEHPVVMKERIKNKNWNVNLDINKKQLKGFKKKLLYFIEKYTGYRIGEYKNYKII